MCHLLIWPVFCSRAKFSLDDIFNEVGNSSQHNFFGDKLFLLFNFCYTISYPLSLFKDGLMRPATKSKLKELLLHEVPPSVALKNLHMYFHRIQSNFLMIIIQRQNICKRLVKH